MALNVFHCTVSNDVSHIAADITQFEVCFPIVGSRHIPRNLAMGNYNDKIVYAGHPAKCNLCGKGYHIS